MQFFVDPDRHEQKIRSYSILNTIASGRIVGGSDRRSGHGPFPGLHHRYQKTRYGGVDGQKPILTIKAAIPRLFIGMMEDRDGLTAKSTIPFNDRIFQNNRNVYVEALDAALEVQTEN